MQRRYTTSHHISSHQIKQKERAMPGMMTSYLCHIHVFHTHLNPVNPIQNHPPFKHLISIQTQILILFKPNPSSYSGPKGFPNPLSLTFPVQHCGVVRRSLPAHAHTHTQPAYRCKQHAPYYDAVTHTHTHTCARTCTRARNLRRRDRRRSHHTAISHHTHDMTRHDASNACWRT